MRDALSNMTTHKKNIVLIRLGRWLWADATASEASSNQTGLSEAQRSRSVPHAAPHRPTPPHAASRSSLREGISCTTTRLPSCPARSSRQLSRRRRRRCSPPCTSPCTCGEEAASIELDPDLVGGAGWVSLLLLKNLLEQCNHPAQKTHTLLLPLLVRSAPAGDSAP